MRKPSSEQEAKMGAWTKEEDQKLIDHIQTYGKGCWHTLPMKTGLRRCGKSCRLRWVNYLMPNIKHGNFGKDEDDLIIKLHALLGNRWSLIAGRLPGRTDNEVKNYWNAHLKRKLIALGIDPNHHGPSQTPPYPRNHSMSGVVTTSFESIKDVFNPIKKNRVGYCNDHDQTYNLTSCLEDDTCGSVDLSLNLNIVVTSSFTGQNHCQDNEITVAKENEDESDEPCTLFLFK